jgi:hypothetical protein
LVKCSFKQLCLCFFFKGMEEQSSKFTNNVLTALRNSIGKDWTEIIELYIFVCCTFVYIPYMICMFILSGFVKYE